jgi:multidrug efflux system membrane fusion protein
VATDQRGDYVLVVNDANQVEYRAVELGLAVGGMREVSAGVSPDDWIVVNGLQRARPGTTVQPQRAKSSADGGLVQLQSSPSTTSEPGLHRVAPRDDAAHN